MTALDLSPPGHPGRCAARSDAQQIRDPSGVQPLKHRADPSPTTPQFNQASPSKPPRHARPILLIGTSKLLQQIRFFTSNDTKPKQQHRRNERRQQAPAVQEHRQSEMKENKPKIDRISGKAMHTSRNQGSSRRTRGNRRPRSPESIGRCGEKSDGNQQQCRSCKEAFHPPHDRQSVQRAQMHVQQKTGQEEQEDDQRRRCDHPWQIS